MTRIIPSIILLVSATLCSAQGPVGTWSDHLTYSMARNIAVGTDEIFASTGSAIMVFNKEYEELKRISRVQGLSGTGISSIAYSSGYNALVIVYTSTDIDIVRDGSITNIPDIKNKYIPGNKEISRVKTSGRYAYLASSFGIVVVDLQKNEIYDTWKPGGENENVAVFDVAFSGNNIYAATESGLYYGDIQSQGLSYFGNWYRVNSLPEPAGEYNAVLSEQDRIYVNRSQDGAPGDSVYVLNGGVSLFSYQPGTYNLSFDNYDGGFCITSKNSASIYNEAGSLVRSVTSSDIPNPDFSQAIPDGNDIWIADRSNGLIRGEGMADFSKLSLPGPYTNDVVFLASSGGKTYISGGAVDNAWNNQWRSLQVFIHQDNSWHSEISSTFKDPMRILPDPSDPEHYWVSTWGMGILEYKDNELKNHFDNTNSPLQTIIPGGPYVRICGLAMDDNRNIWLTQTGVPGSIKMLQYSGNNASWISFPLTIDAPTIGDIIITKTGYKWVILPRGYGLFILDDNRTPDNFSDDRYKSMLVKDSENKVITSVYSITEDLDGNIWVGTDQGPAIYYNPGSVFDEEIKAYRVKVPRDDGTGLADYMLGTEIITSIAVDGANRKWLGTFSSGAYLLSADGTNKLANYTEENSPLLSNTIASVAIDNTTGEVWFGTDKGTISLRGDATAGADEFREVYAFPNPVRETYTGNVTITGLMRNTEIRITDVSGNLVYKTTSDGGLATWDLKNYHGERVSTGVYLVFCSSEDGTGTAVAKMLVIR